MKLPEILKSKKGQALILGLVALICKSLLELSEETTNQIVGLVAAYVLGQGIADHGKEAAKIEQRP